MGGRQQGRAELPAGRFMKLQRASVGLNDIKRPLVVDAWQQGKRGPASTQALSVGAMSRAGLAAGEQG